MNDNGLAILENSPIEAVNKDQMLAAVNRLMAVVPDGNKMTPEQLMVVAQQSILTRTLPGRDIHYFLDRNGNLKQSEDYKFLVAWAIQRERYLTGNPEATFEDSYHELTDQEKISEGVLPDDFAVYCTITTAKDREMFRQEVKGWLDLGLDPDKAVALARETLGNIGTRAIGVVNLEDAYWKDNNGEYNMKKSKMPTGWSPRQKCRKLALKNAIHAKWGVPSVDDLQQMTRGMARVDTTAEDWQNTPVDVPAEEQARYAELEAMKRTAQAVNLTPDQHTERLEDNVIILRGDEVDGIGDDWQDFSNNDFLDFAEKMMEAVPFFETSLQIEAALKKLELTYDPENEDFLSNELAKFANNAADSKAA